MITRPWVLLFVLLCVSSASAERTCRILFLSAPNGAPAKMHLFDGKESQEVILARRNLSPVYKVPAGPLRLQLLPEPFHSVETLPAGAPSVVISEKTGDFYLLIASDPANQVAQVKMAMVPASSRSLSDGDLLWFNLDKVKVAGKLGDRKLMLGPGEIKRIESPIAEKGAYPVDLHYMKEGSDHVHPICSTKWRHDPQSRNLVFVVREPGRAAPVIYSFRDSRR